MKDLLSLQHLGQDEIDHLLDLADRFGKDGIPEAHPGAFVGGLFFNPSLRTRTSMEIATRSLGAHFIGMDAGRGTWSLETLDGAVMDGDKTEHIKDAVGKFLSGAVSCLGVRCFADMDLPYEQARQDPVLSAVAAAAEVPVINLESALFHPMQGLADQQVVRAHLNGDRTDHTIAITWAYHPKPLPMAVAHTALLGFLRAGYRVRLAHPEGFDLDPEIMQHARDEGGERLDVVHNLDEGVRDASVIYAKSWGAAAAYGPGADDESLRAPHRDWIIDARRQALAAPGAFMHCLPVRRNVVVSDDVIDGPHSWVAEQAHCRILTAAAVLHEIL
ncbi:MAG: N-acetylornithine carbamoyltransferase [Planctomycetota bacterium]